MRRERARGLRKAQERGVQRGEEAERAIRDEMRSGLRLRIRAEG
jgi:hypothetical protein